MRDFIISEELINKILQYMSAKPFGEVHAIIQEIMQVRPLTESAPPPNVDAELIED